MFQGPPRNRPRESSAMSSSSTPNLMSSEKFHGFRDPWAFALACGFSAGFAPHVRLHERTFNPKTQPTSPNSRTIRSEDTGSAPVIIA